MKKAFEEAYGKVQAPDALKTETLALMETEDEKFSKVPKAHTTRKIVWGCSVTAAVLCAAVLWLILSPGRGAVYITPMEDGAHYATVELEDGILYFQSERVVISVTPNAGSITGEGVKTDGTAAGGEDGLPAEEVTAQSGGTLTLCKQDRMTLPDIPEEKWSCIDGRWVYVTVLMTENIRYQAAFEKDGMVWEITGNGVTQKEFIDYLYKKIKE